MEWIAAGYTLALDLVVPLSAWLGQRLGLSTVYNAALLGFVITCGLCGLSETWTCSSASGSCRPSRAGYCR